MAKQNSQRPDDLQNMVDNYNKMMDSPIDYANTVYKRQIGGQGRPWGGTRDARTKANKPWDKNGIPV